MSSRFRGRYSSTKEVDQWCAICVEWSVVVLTDPIIISSLMSSQYSPTLFDDLRSRVNAYSSRHHAWLISRVPINLITAYHIRWQDYQECTMQSLAPPSPRCKFTLNIVNYRPSFKHFRYQRFESAIWDLNQKWQPWRYLQIDFPSLNHFLLAC